MSQTNYSRYKYTPDQIDEQEFLDKFVIRTHDFEDIFEDIQNSDFSVPNQHSIIVGQRGQGKTTLLRKVMLEINSDKKLSRFLLPIKFAEEQYQIRSLSRLWEEIADYLQSLHEENFPTILDDMEGHFDDSDYEEKSFSYLEKAVKAKDKRLLLLIDNIDELLGKLKEKEQRKLREILLTSNLFKIIGGSTKMFEQQYDYSKPFYEFFKLIKLTGLNKEESHVFLTSIGNESQKQKIEAIIKNTPERIETLRRLTGGVPRTLVMLFDIFVDEGGDAFDDLIKVLDDATPLYKHRMDDLPETLQEITHTIAMNWDGITAKEIAKKTRMESKVISAQLKQLETKYGLVESVSIGKNKIYKIEERFFNIWYLMRFGRKKDRQKVEWLVNFLSSWCDKDELEHRAQSFMKALNTGYIKANFYLANLYNKETKFDDAEIYYLKAIETGENRALLGLAQLCIYRNQFDKAEKYYFEAINKNVEGVGSKLSLLYFLQAEKLNEALCLTLSEYKNTPIDHTKYTYSLLLLWSEQLQSSYDIFFSIIGRICERDEIDLVYVYLSLLIAKKQLHKAKEIMEIPEYQLKDKLKPIWYALMTLMQDEFPHEIKKMGSELQESVDEVLAEIKEFEVRYALD